MKDVKAPTSRSYHEFLLESLQDPEEAAGYIEVVLSEGSDEPLLLRNALKNLILAHGKRNKLSELVKQHHEKLDKMLSESGCAEIYGLVEILDVLGFRLAVIVKEDYEQNGST